MVEFPNVDREHAYVQILRHDLFMPRGPQSVNQYLMRHAWRIKNKLSQISLFERAAAACRGCTRTSAQDAARSTETVGKRRRLLAREAR